MGLLPSRSLLSRGEQGKRFSGQRGTDSKLLRKPRQEDGLVLVEGGRDVDGGGCVLKPAPGMGEMS